MMITDACFSVGQVWFTSARIFKILSLSRDPKAEYRSFNWNNKDFLSYVYCSSASIRGRCSIAWGQRAHSSMILRPSRWSIHLYHTYALNLSSQSNQISKFHGTRVHRFQTAKHHSIQTFLSRLTDVISAKPTLCVEKYQLNTHWAREKDILMQ